MLGRSAEEAERIIRIAKEQYRIGHPENALIIVNEELMPLSQGFYSMVFDYFKTYVKKRNSATNEREKKARGIVVEMFRELMIRELELQQRIKKLKATLEEEVENLNQQNIQGG